MNTPDEKLLTVGMHLLGKTNETSNNCSQKKKKKAQTATTITVPRIKVQRFDNNNQHLTALTLLPQLGREHYDACVALGANKAIWRTGMVRSKRLPPPHCQSLICTKLLGIS